MGDKIITLLTADDFKTIMEQYHKLWDSQSFWKFVICLFIKIVDDLGLERSLLKYYFLMFIAFLKRRVFGIYERRETN